MWRWYFRIPVKSAVFGLIVLIVCFPFPRLLSRHLHHWRDPSALIDPQAVSLAPLLAEARKRLPDGTPPEVALPGVQELVLERVPYAWDWDNWGLADYLPTVGEVMERGAEDCDGRAVVAASLLAGLGYDARLVTDFAHVWVRTEHGDLMGPGSTTAIEATDHGLSFRLGGLAALPRAFGYGIAVFPLRRELIILLAAWALLVWPELLSVRSYVSLAMLVGGLLLLRSGGREYLNASVWAQVAGAAIGSGGMVLAFLGRPRSRATGGSAGTIEPG